jgi:transcriptional regulator with XRE-family HTH domain
MATRAEIARERIKVDMARQGVSGRKLADLLGWSQSKFAHTLTGYVQLTVDDLAAIAEALGVPLVEFVREPRLELVADMTPTEVRLHQRIRTLPEAERAAVMTLLRVEPADDPTKPGGRRAGRAGTARAGSAATPSTQVG